MSRHGQAGSGTPVAAGRGRRDGTSGRPQARRGTWRTSESSTLPADDHQPPDLPVAQGTGLDGHALVHEHDRQARPDPSSLELGPNESPDR
jgi:hypothetical protein